MLDQLLPGEVGFFTAAIKEVADTRVGDTVTDDKNPTPDSARLQAGRSLSCSAVSSPLMRQTSKICAKRWRNFASTMPSPSKRKAQRPWASASAAASWDCHLEIITERLAREFNLDLITTAPSVIYHLHMVDGSIIEMHNPADMPDVTRIDHIEEPWIEATILVPDEHLGSVLKLCQDRRGRQTQLTYAGSRAMVQYDLPLNEVVFGLLRPPKERVARLRLVRLSHQGLRGGRPRQACPFSSIRNPWMRSPSSCIAPVPKAVAAPCARS